MIVVDANLFLRHLADPATPEDRAMAAIASDLFLAAADGRMTLWVSEAVVAEVLFILTDAQHYGLPREAAADELLALLELDHVETSDKDCCLNAIRRWRGDRRISFVDALVAGHGAARGAVATFDRRLQRIVGDDLWPPCRPAAWAILPRIAPDRLRRDRRRPATGLRTRAHSPDARARPMVCGSAAHAHTDAATSWSSAPPPTTRPPAA